MTSVEHENASELEMGRERKGWEGRKERERVWRMGRGGDGLVRSRNIRNVFP